MSQQYNPPPGPPPQHQQQEPEYPAYPQQNTSSHGQQGTTSYGQNAPSYGHNAPSYGQDTHSYGQNAPSYGQTNAPPNPPPRRTGTDAVLPAGEDRTEQMETFQAYEANKPQSAEDKAQETLQREFPGIDSSLIMAIWNDSQDLGQTREMLQELSRNDGA